MTAGMDTTSEAGVAVGEGLGGWGVGGGYRLCARAVRGVARRYCLVLTGSRAWRHLERGTPSAVGLARDSTITERPLSAISKTSN